MHRHQHTSLTVVTKEDEEDEEEGAVYVPLEPEKTSSWIHQSIFLFVLTLTIDCAVNVTYLVKETPTNLSFNKSILDVIILFGVRVFCGLLYATTKRMYVLAYWTGTFFCFRKRFRERILTIYIHSYLEHDSFAV